MNYLQNQQYVFSRLVKCPHDRNFYWKSDIVYINKRENGYLILDIIGVPEKSREAVREEYITGKCEGNWKYPELKYWI